MTAVKNKNQFLENILKNIRDAVFIIDKTAKIEHVNRSACTILGIQEFQIVGKLIKEFFPKDSIRKQRIHKLDQSNVDVVLVNSRGEEKEAMISSQQIGESSEGLRMIIAVDQSFQNRADKLIAMQQKTITQMSKLSILGELASEVAHEVNTPLQVLGGRCEIMAMKKAHGKRSEEDVDHGFALIEEMADRIGGIVKGLQTFSRDQSSQPMRAVKLNRIIEDTLALYGDRMLKKGISFKVPDSIEEILVNCHSTQISQIILNLLNNAADAVLQTNDPWVSLEIETYENEVQIVVKDSGTGIGQVTQHKLFNPFFTTKEEGKGTGLGLSISKSLAEGHSGKLFYELRDGHTAFVLEISGHLVDQKSA